MKTRRFTVRLTMAVAMAAGFLGLSAPTASADSVVSRIDVYSPSMDRWIANDVISPAGGGPAPTFYLLTGVGGGEDGISWFNNTGVRDFFDDKHVNVVMPVGGKFSMYTDWNADDPVLGRNKWQTYLTKELPAAVNARYNTTGVNALGGVSMAGGPVLDLAIQSPGTYRQSARTAAVRAPATRSVRQRCGRWSRYSAAATRPTCGGRGVARSGRRTTR